MPMETENFASGYEDPIDTTAERPLFMIGCVRSGTTLVRDLIKRGENIICPEETHYYRWGEPFGTRGFERAVLNGPVLKAHRKRDGLREVRFAELYRQSTGRGDLLVRHVREMARSRGLSTYRWFDKTPQNVYGLNMIADDFPDAVYLHMVRNPLNVVTSLKIGKVIKIDDIRAACSYWLEAVALVRQFRKANERKVLEVRYEDLVEDVPRHLAEIFRLFDQPYEPRRYSVADANPERNLYRKHLDDEEVAFVRRQCGQVAERYGYLL